MTAAAPSTLIEQSIHCTRKEIEALGGPKKSHLYSLIAKGQFPAPAVRLGPRYTRWATEDVLAWLRDPADWIARHTAEATNHDAVAH